MRILILLLASLQLYGQGGCLGCASGGGGGGGATPAGADGDVQTKSGSSLAEVTGFNIGASELTIPVPTNISGPNYSTGVKLNVEADDGGYGERGITWAFHNAAATPVSKDFFSITGAGSYALDGTISGDGVYISTSDGANPLAIYSASGTASIGLLAPVFMGNGLQIGVSSGDQPDNYGLVMMSGATIPHTHNFIEVHDGTNGGVIQAKLDPTFSWTMPSIQLAAANQSKPTCNAGNRGRIWYTAGNTGVADVWERCHKDVADSYAWTTF